MASVRKSQRSRSGGGEQTTPTQSPNSKRKRVELPSPSSSATITNHLPHDAERVLVEESTEVDDVDVEEEVVTVDVMEADQSLSMDEMSSAEIFETVEETVVDSAGTPGQTEAAEISEIGEVSSLGESSSEPEKPASVFVFKDPNFVHSSKGAGGNKRTRVWKNLKQIVAAERLLPWGPEDVTYGSIDAPPSFKPAKKYSDISGLESKYTDPQTKMRYANADEYRRIRMLPGDIITGCLALRKANNLVP